MSKLASSEWHKGGHQRGAKKYEGRRGIITRAARLCLERKGVAKTSIADITREVDITRELFYYYFSNKMAVVSSVMDSYVEEAHTLFEERVGAADSDAPTMLLQLIEACRQWLATSKEAPFSMLDLLFEANMWNDMLYRVAGEAVEALHGAVPSHGPADAEASTTELRGQRMGIMGAMTAMLSAPELTDEQLADALVPLF